jgi:putative two-component system response regulator
MTRSTAARGRVLVVEDDRATRDLLVRMLTRESCDTEAVSDAEQGRALIDRRPPDLVLLDVGLPGMDGFDLCQEIKQNVATRLIPVVLVTGANDRQSRIRGIDAGADDFIAKPFDAEELKARLRSLIRLKRYTDELDSAESIILSLALTIEARDADTDGHCERLARYATALGARLGLGAEEQAALYRGGFLHDVGKIGIPDAILLKPTPLTPDEYEVMKRHTVIGHRLCGELRSLRLARSIVRHHHERLDGSGYPDGLVGDAIPLLAQIVGIADTYDAMTTDRPYRAARPPEAAYQALADEANQHLRRSDLVSAFIGLGPL